MSMELAESGGGLGESQIVVLIGQTVDFTFVQNLGFATVENLNAAFNSTSSGLGAKVDKVGGTAGTPWIKYAATGGRQSNPTIGPYAFVNTGEIDILAQANRFIVDAVPRYNLASAEFAAGIAWDLGGQNVALSGCASFSVTTSNTNVKVFDCGVGKDNVLRSYDNTKRTVVIGAENMSVPIFEVWRISGTVTTTVMQINDVPQPSAASMTTLAHVIAALVALGIFKA